MSRPGVKNRKSTAAILSELDRDATEIEQQLAAGIDSEKANQLRVPLCEKLSKIILMDAAYACEHNVCARLWSKCFYERISPLRAGIMKEKRKKRPCAKQETLLAAFIGEGVTFFAYICDKLHLTLSGAAQDDFSMSQGGTTVSGPPLTPPTLEGVVECMQRLYISLGDLYRYSQNLSKAESAYQRSARLGPGHGHP
jgi:hypothetical protein